MRRLSQRLAVRDMLIPPLEKGGEGGFYNKGRMAIRPYNTTSFPAVLAPFTSSLILKETRSYNNASVSHWARADISQRGLMRGRLFNSFQKH
jgi:hypothetical protein